MLYQRYFLRMNQTNMMHMLGLLMALSLALTMVQARALVLAQTLLNELAATANGSELDSYE